ncbi:hypothetical protein [Novosphingobium sp. JCM 18896]|uniref:hypothetical protein n=1 Tax=Novosphingobium sp. JCM 18896 TaxID=2989731 RepID=UPI0022236594|nr:hypothetical protein [Novosphingobium sp. JCM 18896]MCW1430289.1 hypothetical protein [Novosphingobium sp. JCM 18896]
MAKGDMMERTNPAVMVRVPAALIPTLIRARKSGVPDPIGKAVNPKSVTTVPGSSGTK